MSCQESESPVPGLPIQGVWQQRITMISNPETTFIKELHFKVDGTYELTSRIVNNITLEPTEYFTLITGHYEIRGDKLKRFNVDEYIKEIPQKKYTRSELVHKGFQAELPLVIVSLDEKAEKLTMDYRRGECPNPIVNYCIDVESYLKGS